MIWLSLEFLATCNREVGLVNALCSRTAGQIEFDRVDNLVV